MDSDTQPAIEEYGLLESLNREWLRLPLAAIRECGPATQTLAGIFKITNKGTFVALVEIARRSRLPERTVRRHLRTLIDTDWIESRGRERTRQGRPRRTNTLILTPRAIAEAKASYLILPWWACFDAILPAKLSRKRWTRWKGLTWGAKVLLALVMSRLMEITGAAAKQFENYADDPWAGIDLLGGDDRFRFSLRAIERQTGLDHKTIAAAKRLLRRLGMIDWHSSALRADGGEDTDYLTPRLDEFIVRVRPTSPGKCAVEWLPNFSWNRQ